MTLRNTFCSFVFLFMVHSIMGDGGGTNVIAHRGYWKCNGSAQNSIKAIERAGEIKAYGSEFDVIIAYDGIPVVNHNNDYEGKHVETTPYSELKNLKLANGEKFPSLEEYIIAGKKNPDTQMILEIKPHSTPEKDIEAAHRVTALVQAMSAREQVEYITFSLTLAKELIRLDPQAKVAYLNGELSPNALKELGFTGLDYHFNVLQKNPTWIKEAQKLGLSVNVWTVNEPEKMKEMIAAGVDYITTDEPEVLQNILKK